MTTKLFSFRYSNQRVEIDNTQEKDDKDEEVDLAVQQRLLQIKQQQEAARQLFQQQQQQQLEEQLVQQQQQQQHLHRLLFLKQQQAESQQHNQWLYPNLVQGRSPFQKKVDICTDENDSGDCKLIMRLLGV